MHRIKLAASDPWIYLLRALYLQIFGFRFYVVVTVKGITTNSITYGIWRFNVTVISILSQINLIPRIFTYFLKIYFNIVLSSTPRPT